MKKLASLLIVSLIGLPVLAQNAGQLYVRVSAATAYLVHAVFMDPTLCRNVELFKKWESASNIKLLSSYFPLFSGSGFLIGDEGILLTNRHVVQIDNLADIRMNTANGYARKLEQSPPNGFSAEDIRVLKLDVYSMITKGSYRFSATIGGTVVTDIETVAISKENGLDLAVLKLPGGFTHGLVLADAEALNTKLIGKEVFSFGFPLGASLGGRFKDLVVTMNGGMISAIRNEDLGIQHSAAISHGNSGGPLVDGSGTVLGMNTATIEEGNSLFLALGVDRIRAFLSKQGIEIPRQDSEIQSVEMKNSTAAISVPVVLRALAEPATPPEPVVSSGIEVSSKVSVESEKGATVFINGEKVGAAPIIIPVTNSASTIVVRGDNGMFTAVLRLNTSLHGITVLKADLHRTGDLFITSNETAVRVILDGNDLGALGSGVFHEQPVGDHRLELVGQELYFSQAISIGADTSTQIQANVRPVGSLEIKVPSDVQTTISSGAYSTTISGSASLDHIPTGEYSLKSGGGDNPAFSTTFSLQKGVEASWDPYSLGVISFAVNPAGSQCLLGAEKTLQTNTEAAIITPGSYTGVIKHPGYHDQEISFTVLAGKRTIITTNLTELTRGTIVLPRLGSPIVIKIQDLQIKGKDGPDGAVLYERIPCGLPVGVAFISTAGATTNIPDQQVSLSEGETRTLDIPSGRFTLPWLPLGAVVDIETAPKIILNNEGRQGYLSPPLPPGQYSVGIHDGSKGTDCTLTVMVLPNAATEPSDYRSAMLGDLDALKEADAQALAHRHTKTTIGITSLVTGIVGVAGVVAFYFIGSHAMNQYQSATDTATATARWSNVGLYQDLFYASAGVGGVGLGLSPFFLSGGPDPKALQRSIDALNEGITALRK